eukprot:842410-Pleurochrysis_carterae.AAC.1
MLRGQQQQHYGDSSADSAMQTAMAALCKQWRWQRCAGRDADAEDSNTGSAARPAASAALLKR